MHTLLAVSLRLSAALAHDSRPAYLELVATDAAGCWSININGNERARSQAGAPEKDF